MRRSTQNDSAYSGFEYRWNYDEYQKSLQKQRRRVAGNGMQAFFLTTVFVFLICFASLVMVLGAAFMRGEARASLDDGAAGAQGKQPSMLQNDTNEVESEDAQSPYYEGVQLVSDAAFSGESGLSLLGILGENVTHADAVRYRLPIGVRITTVRENDSADRAGLRRNDILLEIENMPISTISELAAWEKTVILEKNVSVRIYRGGEEISLNLVVERETEDLTAESE